MLFGLCFMFVWALALGCIYLKTCGCYGGPYESLLNYSSVSFLNSFPKIQVPTLSAIILEINFRILPWRRIIFRRNVLLFFCEVVVWSFLGVVWLCGNVWGLRAVWLELEGVGCLRLALGYGSFED